MKPRVYIAQSILSLLVTFSSLSSQFLPHARPVAPFRLARSVRPFRLCQAQVDMYKNKFVKLHEMVLATYENEKVLLVKAKELHAALTGERTKLEERSAQSTSNNNLIQQLRADLVRARFGPIDFFVRAVSSRFFLVFRVAERMSILLSAFCTLTLAFYIFFDFFVLSHHMSIHKQPCLTTALCLPSSRFTFLPPYLPFMRTAHTRRIARLSRWPISRSASSCSNSRRTNSIARATNWCARSTKNASHRYARAVRGMLAVCCVCVSLCRKQE